MPSGDGRRDRRDLRPEAWGPSTWRCLHAVAEGAPDSPSPEERIALRAFVDALPELLPCAKCRRHLRELYARGLRPRVESREALSRDLWELHNAVNAALGKKREEPGAWARDLAGGKATHGGRRGSGAAAVWAAVAFVAAVALVALALSALRGAQCGRGTGGPAGLSGGGPQRRRPRRRRGF